MPNWATGPYAAKEHPDMPDARCGMILASFSLKRSPIEERLCDCELQVLQPAVHRRMPHRSKTKGTTLIAVMCVRLVAS
eukprot:1425820-Prymnesium_polylepis.1